MTPQDMQAFLWAYPTFIFVFTVVFNLGMIWADKGK